jgi:predicted O-linked N-acetylglucosamine transferase (SPINDLY family)/regulator of sirC expression with transglutaminase-like and TPR domain
MIGHSATPSKGGAGGSSAALLQQAAHLHRQGRSQVAEEMCNAVLASEASNAAALHLRGLIAMERGHTEAGVRDIERSLAHLPAQPAAHSNLGNALLKLGKPLQALESFDRALRLAPDYAVAHYNRGNALLQLARHAEAIESYDHALQGKPNHHLAFNNKGSALFALQRWEEALASVERSLELEANHADAHRNRGIILAALKRHDEALDSYSQALRLGAAEAETLRHRGAAYRALDRHEDALADYQRAVQLDPESFEAWNLCGIVLLGLRRPLEALGCLDHALRILPNDANALNNRGIALLALQRPLEALACFEASWDDGASAPVEPLLGRAQALDALKRSSEAVRCLELLLQRAPEYPYARGALTQAQLDGCEWQGIGERVERVLHGVEQDRAVITPFSLLALCGTPRQQLRCARQYARDKYPSAADSAPWTGPVYAHGRIRLGYVSADLREHAVSYLMAGVFEQHDRQRFEVIGLSLLGAESSPMGNRVRAAFDRFIDVSEMDDGQVVRLMRELQIDIAIDLMGYTRAARSGIFARRAAPVQVNYLGYPGTMGAGFMDYLIADEFVIPPASREHYSEQVVYLPDCFQANDDRREIAAVPTRAQAGLPERGVVFCCFNSNYKINPSMFDLWCRLLSAVQESVLWLVEDNPTAGASLLREAAARGVDRRRLIFAQRLPYARHLARLGLADLFLDTLPFNAGTTASDALWAGVPVITCAGEAFASRMAGSLLRALGLEQLITYNLADYERLAIRLAADPMRLSELRSELLARRGAHGPFDTAAFCRQLEDAYRHMCQRARERLPPASAGITHGTTHV